MSAYASESVELRRALLELRKAMLARMDDSAQRGAAKRVPGLTAGVSGLSPFLVAQAILSPLSFEWFAGELPRALTAAVIALVVP